MKEKEFKPILASNAEIDKIKYPVLVSCKLDGIRTIIKDGKPVTRMLKDIPNTYIRNELTKLFENIPGVADGELIVGKTFQETSSAVMSFDGEPEFIYYIFDYVESSFTKPFVDRIKDLNNLLTRIMSVHVIGVEHEPIENYEQLQACEEFWLSEDYEGICIRSFDSRYKFGRSTVKEGILLKIKRFTDSEAKIIGFQELMHNNNEAKKDLLGHTDRATCKENLIGMNTLGSLQVRDIVSGVEFSIGTGFDADLRKKIWDNQATYINQLVKYKHQEAGMKDLPRFPVFLGFRDPSDMS